MDEESDFQRAASSGISNLIALAEIADHHMDEALAREIRGAHQLVTERMASGKDQSWGTLYLEDCKQRALAAIREFDALDPSDAVKVLAVQMTLREYRRVASFASELLKTADAVKRQLDGDDPLDDEVGEPLYHGEEPFQG